MKQVLFLLLVVISTVTQYAIGSSTTVINVQTGETNQVSVLTGSGIRPTIGWTSRPDGMFSLTVAIEATNLGWLSVGISSSDGLTTPIMTGANGGGAIIAIPGQTPVVKEYIMSGYVVADVNAYSTSALSFTEVESCAGQFCPSEVQACESQAICFNAVECAYNKFTLLQGQLNVSTVAQQALSLFESCATPLTNFNSPQATTALAALFDAGGCFITYCTESLLQQELRTSFVNKTTFTTTSTTSTLEVLLSQPVIAGIPIPAAPASAIFMVAFSTITTSFEAHTPQQQAFVTVNLATGAIQPVTPPSWLISHIILCLIGFGILYPLSLITRSYRSKRFSWLPLFFIFSGLILAAAGSVLISASSSSTGPMDVHSIISIISIMLVLTSLFIILMQPSDAGSDNTAWAKAAMKGVQDKEDYDTSAKECNAFISGFSRIFDYTTVAVICASFITGVTDIEASAIDNNPGYFVVAVIGCGFCGFGVLVNFIVPLICGKRALNEESDKVGTQSASNPRFVEGEVDAPEDNDVVPLILSWEKVGLEVSKRSGELKTILKNSAGFCAPRTLTAVLGPSGAGKSSLMEILALRTVRAPTAESKVLINGNPAGNYKGVHRLMGYVPQHDILHEYLTVLETLQFTSQLTLSQSMSEQAKVDRMLRVVAQLGLGHILDTRVGGENVRGISGGERRRVSIALQMIKSPSILFLDEPTSGLDAHLALRLVKVLRELANEGRTVFATIHQPSAACFEYFDRTIILSAGFTVYSGSRTGALVFMKENGREVPFNWNPADWLLTVVDVERDERVIQEDGDQVVYKNDAQTETILRRRGIISVDQRFKATTSVSALSLDVAELRDCVKMYYKQVNPTKLVEQPGVIEEIVTYALSKGVDALDKKLRSRYNVSITPLMSGRQRKQNLEPCTMDELKALISKFTASYHGAELMDRVRGAKEDARHSLSIAVANSHAAAVLKELEEGALKNDGSSDELVFSRSFLDQSRLLAQRSLRLFWRNPQAFRFQAFQNLLFGVILGALYSNSSKLQSSTFQETIFIAIIEAMVAFVTVGLGTQVAFNERLVLEREMSDAMYSPIAHYLQRLIVSIPVSSLVAVCLILPSYFWIGLNSSPSAFFFFCFVNVLIVFCFDSVVFFITLIATDINNAWAIGNFYEAMTIFFAGVFIPLYAMPVYFQWLYFLSPFSYAFAAAVVNQFTGSTQGFIVESQGILLQNAWGNAMILLGFGVMWRLLGLYGIIRLFRKKRPGNMAWHKRHDRADIIGFDSKSPALSV